MKKEGSITNRKSELIDQLTSIGKSSHISSDNLSSNIGVMSLTYFGQIDVQCFADKINMISHKKSFAKQSRQTYRLEEANTTSYNSGTLHLIIHELLAIVYRSGWKERSAVKTARD